MTRARGKCLLALTVVFALVAMFAVPALAIAEESVVSDQAPTVTEAPAVTEAAPGTEVAPAAEVTTETAPVAEVAPVEDAAPLQEPAPVKEVEAADTSATATGSSWATPLGSKVGTRLATKKTTSTVSKRTQRAKRGAALLRVPVTNPSGSYETSPHGHHDVCTAVAGANATSIKIDDGNLVAGGTYGPITIVTRDDYGFTWTSTTTVHTVFIGVANTHPSYSGGMSGTASGTQQDLSHAIFCFPAPPPPCTSWTLTVNLTNATATLASGTYTTNPGTVTGTATAAANHSSDGTSTGATTASLSAVFTATDCTKTVSASFQPIQSGGCPSYTLSTPIASDDSGHGTASAVSVTNLGTADGTPWAAGEQVSLQAPAIAGYTFTNWTGDRATSTDNPLTVTFATTDTDCILSMTANYTKNTSGGCDTYTLNTGFASTDNGATGAIGVNNLTTDGSPWLAGETIRLTAPSISGYTFSSWSGDRTATTNPLDATFATSDSDCVLNLNANYTKDQGCQSNCGEVITDCNGDNILENNGPFGDCTNPPPVNDCSGDTDPTNNGINGDCTNPPPVNDCSGDTDPTNNGINGDCEEPVVDATDLCPNIDGDQSAVPQGMFVSEDGECLEPDAVLGIRFNAKPELGFAPAKPDAVLGLKVAPQNVAAGVLPFTGASLVPFLIMSGLLLSLGTSLTIRSRKGSAS